MNTATWIRTMASGSWELAFLDAAIKATLLVAVAILATWLLRQASAALRHRIWCLTFGALIVLPVLSWGLPAWRIAILPASPAQPATAPAAAATVTQPTSANLEIATATNPDSTRPQILDADATADLMFPAGSGGLSTSEIRAGELAAAEGMPAPSRRWWTSAIALWVAGVLLSAVAFGLSVVGNVWLRFKATRVTDSTWIRLRDELSQRLGLRRPVELLETDLPLVPMTWGIVKSIVLVPLEARGWADCLKRTVLLHELAHVKRCDVGFQILARLACAIYWFHPLAWYGLRRLRIERELACDDCVLSAGERPSDYARGLLDIARRFRPIGLGAAVAMAQTNNLEGRVRALFDRARSHLPLGPRSARLLLASSAVLVAAIAVVKPGSRAADPSEPDSNSPSSEAPAAESESANAINDGVASAVTVRGTVLAPDGQPLANATVRAATPVWATLEPIVDRDAIRPVTQVTTDANGRFKVTFSKQPFGDLSRFGQQVRDIWKKTRIVAVSSGHGPAWVAIENMTLGEPITLRLVEDLPVKGRVVDLEGRPLGGVTVKVGGPSAAEDEDLTPWLNAAKAGELPWTIHKHAPKSIEPGLVDIRSEISTDEQGRFEIRGVGRNRHFSVVFEGEAVAHKSVTVVTRRMEPIDRVISTPPFEGTELVYGAEFTFAAAPSRPIEGAVRDADTGEPLPGVSVESYKLAGYPYANHRVLKTATDEKGRFRLIGMPKGKDNRLLLVPNDEQPYFMREVDVPDPPGLDPVTVDIELHRGVWITGRVTDKVTGEAVHARLHYLPLRSNTFAQAIPEFDDDGNTDGDQTRYQSKPDGTFRLAGLPGRAIVGAESVLKPYRRGVGYDAINAPKYGNTDHFDTYRNPVYPGPKWPNVMKEIDPPADAESVEVNFEMDAGLSLRVTTVDPDGRPVRSVEVHGRSSRGYSETMEESTFEVINFSPGEERTIIFYEEKGNLGCVTRLGPREATPGSITVQLQPCATVMGRLLDEGGTPYAGLAVKADVRPSEDFGKELPPVATDLAGRFRYTIVPGCKYSLHVEGAGIESTTIESELAIEPGEAKDLGELIHQPQSRKFVRRAEAESEAKASTNENATSPVERSEKNSAQQPSPRAVDAEAINIRGQVVGPDGRPLSGIAVYRHVSKVPQPRLPGDIALERCAISAADGRFALTMSRSDWPTWASQVPLVAYHEVHGLAWDQISHQPDSQEVTLKLSEDEPIRGRILDTQGRPIAGARVRVNAIFVSKSENLDDLLTAWKQEWGQALHMGTKCLYHHLASILDATTDQAGRFELRGIGRDRIAMLHVSAPATAHGVLLAVTRPAFDPRPYNEAVIAQTVPDLPRPPQTPVMVGPAFDHVAEPELVIEGRVYADEKRTGVSGALVSATTGYSSTAAAIADMTGRFELRGLPRGEERFVHIHAPVPNDLLARVVSIGLPPGESVVRLDVELKRGVVVTGRILDRQTGAGVPGGVSFAPLPDNPYLAQPGYDGYKRSGGALVTDRDGRFRLVIIPGPGVLMAHASGRETPMGDQPLNPYQQARFSEEDRQHVTVSGSGQKRYFTTADNSNESLSGENAVKWLDGEPGKGPIECNLYVERGETVEVRILDEQGEPLSGACVSGLTESWPIAYRLQEPTCTVYALDPQQPRTVIFYHPDRLLSSIVAIRGDEPGPLDVRLAPVHSLAGRAVDTSGAPLADADVHPGFADDAASELYRLLKLERKPIRTDATGRFRLDGVIGGLEFRIHFQQGQNWFVNRETRDMALLAAKAAAGADEAVDLGDITVNPP